MCHAEIAVRSIERRYGIEFHVYFDEALRRLRPMIEDGLLRIEPDRIVASSQGRLLLRNMAMCFDRYLNGGATPIKFSRAI